MLRPPFVAVRDADQCWLRPGIAKKLQSDGEKLSDIARRHGDGWKPRGRRELLAIVSVWRVEVSDQARGVVPGRIDDRVEGVPGHECSHPAPEFVVALRLCETPGLFLRRLFDIEACRET